MKKLQKTCVFQEKSVSDTHTHTHTNSTFISIEENELMMKTHMKKETELLKIIL